MKTPSFTLHYLAAITILLLAAFGVPAATFTNDGFIGINNTNFDGQDIIVTNCTLTVDGAHSFTSVQLLNGAVLTHSFSTNGLLENRLSIAGELHALSSTNPAALSQTNVLTNTVVVSGPTGNTYQAGTDYGVVVTNAITLITLLPGSNIPDGAMISASYSFLATPVAAGLFLTVSNNLEIEIGAAINATAKGYAGGLGPGAGASLGTKYPYPFTAGSGGATLALARRAPARLQAAALTDRF